MQLDEPNPDEGGNGARSEFRLEISLAIGYQRRRARLATKLEANVVSIALLIGGTAVVLLFLWFVLTRLAVV